MQRRSLLFVSLTLPLLIFVYVAVKRQPSVLDGRIHDQQVKNVWSSLVYEEIEATPEFRRRLEGMNITTNSPISHSQVSALLDTIYDLMTALKFGNYDDYRRFRTPISAQFNRDLMNYWREEFAKQNTNAIVSTNDEEFFRSYFSFANHGRGLSNFWTGVALSNATVVIEEGNQLPTNNVWQLILAHDNLGVFQPNPTFLFKTTPESILERGERLYWATCHLVSQHGPPDPPYAACVRYYWDSEVNHWIPWEFGSANAGNRYAEIIW